MATPEMKTRRNRRGLTENFVEGSHLKLKNLKVAAQDLDNDYLFQSNIPVYPRPEFHVSRLKHDTNLAGLRGIREKGGFINPHNGSLLWFSLDVGPEEIEAAEKRLLKTTYPDRTEEQIQSQQRLLEKFATSPAFLRSSRYGSYRFTFSVEEVLEAYKDQFCSGAEPIMRVMETVLYKQEVMYVVLVHSPSNEKQFRKYPLLAENPDPICTFRNRCFRWRSEAMCETHRFGLIKDAAAKRMEAVEVEGRRKWYVWDHVTIALHVDDQVLKFDMNHLRKKLTFCVDAPVVVDRFEDFPTAAKVVSKLWPKYPLRLMGDWERAQEVPEEDQRPTEAEDDLSEVFAKLNLKSKTNTKNEKHKLVKATFKLQENICSRHHKVLKIYCRTDQRCICYLCSMDEHKGHDTVSAAAERAERQAELGLSRQKIQQRVQDRERDVKLLQQRVEAFNLSADEAVRDSKKSLTQLIRLLKKTRSEVMQQIRDQQDRQVSEATELEEKLQQEITDLRRKDAELEKLSRSEDHLHFLNNYPSLSGLSPPEDRPSIHLCPLGSFKDVTAAVSEVKDKLQAVLRDHSLKISSAVTEVKVLPSPAEPTTRDQFLRYSARVTLDPNTTNRWLSLSDGDRKVTFTVQDQVYANHPDRFVDRCQVRSKEGLTGRCYWEVKWSGWVEVVVVYKDISRTGNESGFGVNCKSWSLICYSDGLTFMHNKTRTCISGPPSSTIGVYLDHEAGTLSYYRVSDTMTLLHRVQTRFTQPLYPGLGVYEGSAEFVELQ